MGLKERVFSSEKEISLEEIVESKQFTSEEIFKPEPDIIIYGNSSYYYVYRKEEIAPVWSNYIKSEKQKEEQSYGLFMPSGVMVNRVPGTTLGNGVLGRAFIHSGYIEILDSLFGSEYQEVLTHEILHILHPEKGEMDIRQMTRYQLGNNTTYH